MLEYHALIESTPLYSNKISIKSSSARIQTL